jgi:hypothetical protein
VIDFPLFEWNEDEALDVLAPPVHRVKPGTKS